MAISFRTVSLRLSAAAATALILSGPVLAQTPTPATPAAPAASAQPATKTAPAKTKPERTAASLDCSKQADAKGLHGKERHKFRSECKKTAGKAD